MKWKELRITFSHSRKNFDPVKLNGQDLELVQQVKILRLQILCGIATGYVWLYVAHIWGLKESKQAPVFSAPA